MDDVSPELKRLLDYIDGQEASDEFTKKLEIEVRTVRNNEKWRIDYMTLEMRYRELFEQALEQGVEQEKMETALRMLQAGKLSIEEISIYSGLTVEQVLTLKDEL